MTKLGVTLLMITAIILTCGQMAKAERVFPGEHWEYKEPSAVGLDPEKLEAFKEYIGGRGCVVRNGYILYTWGDYKRPSDIASACKPIYSHLLFKALEEKRIPSLDEKVARWEPRLNEINASIGHKDRNITWRHMANQTSCYGVTEQPGSAYNYNDWQMALFFDTLFLKVYGATYENINSTVLGPRLTDLIGCEDNPTLTVFGAGNRPGRVGISPRDFARFALLYMRKGNWNGKQIVDEKLAVAAVTSPVPNSVPRSEGKEAEMIDGQRTIGSQRVPDNQTDHYGSYSWAWWVNGINRDGNRHWPDAPKDTFGAFGHANGQRAVVAIPSLDLIVSWNDTNLGRLSDNPQNQALKLLVSAVVSGSK